MPCSVFKHFVGLKVPSSSLRCLVESQNRPKSYFAVNGKIDYLYFFAGILYVFSCIFIFLSLESDQCNMIAHSDTEKGRSDKTIIYNVDRFVASSLFCVRLYLKSYIAGLIYFDDAEIKDTTTTTTY